MKLRWIALGSLALGALSLRITQQPFVIDEPAPPVTVAEDSSPGPAPLNPGAASSGLVYTSGQTFDSPLLCVGTGTVLTLGTASARCDPGWTLVNVGGAPMCASSLAPARWN